MMRRILALTVLLCMANVQAADVMTWVAPYAIAPSYHTLTKDFDGVGMKDGLSRLALQFWRPTQRGGLEKDVAYGIISDADIKKFAQLGDANNIEIMLCIYNPPPKEGEPWDWALAQAAFNNPAQFIDAVLQEIERLERLGISIDGVDMDLESSIDQSEEDKTSYMLMMKLLAQKLEATGKKLTVATYQAKFNAPNINYWPELISIVDGITPMGYENMGYQVLCPEMWGHSSNWCTYDAQIAAVGNFDRAKLTLGMPGGIPAWMGKSVLDHLDGIQRLGTGVAIWDANLHSSWQTAEVWNKIKAIKNSARSSAVAEK